MTAFDLSRYVEDQGMARLIPLLKQYADGGQFVINNKGPLAPMLQATVGDALLNRNGGVYGLEVKIEQEFTGNFYLELWSNKKFDPRKVGWMVSLNADILWYYFLDVDLLFSMSFHRLWKWAFVEDQRSVAKGRGRIYDFPEKLQRKAAQLNETWGRCVPIATVYAEVGFVMYKPSKSFDPMEYVPPKGQITLAF